MPQAPTQANLGQKQAKSSRVHTSRHGGAWQILNCDQAAGLARLVTGFPAAEGNAGVVLQQRGYVFSNGAHCQHWLPNDHFEIEIVEGFGDFEEAVEDLCRLGKTDYQ